MESVWLVRLVDGIGGQAAPRGAQVAAATKLIAPRCCSCWQSAAASLRNCLRKQHQKELEHPPQRIQHAAQLRSHCPLLAQRCFCLLCPLSQLCTLCLPLQRPQQACRQAA